jgi:two-component system, LytTR family, response regulator
LSPTASNNKQHTEADYLFFTKGLIPIGSQTLPVSYMTTLIIEDDPDSRNVLRMLLNAHFPTVRLLAECATAAEGVAAIRSFRPNLVFLDIGLPDQTGFEMLQSLEQIDFDIIFVSAHDHFAAQAFRWSAVDYLLKPITGSLLREAIDRALERRQLPNAQQQLRLLLENINSLQRAKPLAKLALPTATDIEFVNVNDIVRIEGDKNYSTFFLNDKRKITVSKTLGEYERMLEDTTFMRIQKSHLVNLVYIKKYLKGDGGGVVMADGAELPVSPLKREGLLERIVVGA